MASYNFDKVVNRQGTGALKVDALNLFFGKSDIMPLWVADMDFEICDDIIEALQNRISHGIYGYSMPSNGYWQSIINWQKEKYNFDITKDELNYVPGVVKGIALAVNYFTKEGDNIVIQPPVYHPFKMVIDGNKRNTVNNPLVKNGDSYSMDLDGLEEIFKSKKPKMMILCNPHNPAGIMWEADELKQLATLCKKYNVIVISDEIHGDLGIFGNEHIPFAMVSKEAEDISITFGAPSKTFNIPGLVSSWVVIKNKELRDGFYHWLEVNEFNSPTFFATIATEAAYTKGDEWLKQAKCYIEENIEFVESYISSNIPAIKVIRPQASFLIWLDCTGLGLGHKELLDTFINKAGLALNDGMMFGKEGFGHMRMNIATRRDNLKIALDNLAKALK